VVNAIFAHHGDADPITVEAALVAAADALSAARPGVRRESIEHYLKRLEDLEKLALSFKGVEKCYAIQAGREIRIIVKPEEVNDELSALIARDLSKKIEAEMSYPAPDKGDGHQGVASCGICKVITAVTHYESIIYRRYCRQGGRNAVNASLPGLTDKYKIDLVIANAENIAGGFGLTESLVQDFTGWASRLSPPETMYGTRRILSATSPKTTACFVLRTSHQAYRVMEASSIPCLTG